MFQFHFYRRCALNILLATQASLFLTLAARADDPVYATVAILLPADAAAFDNPVAVIFGGPRNSDPDDGLVIESGLDWGAFSGADLLNTDAIYIGRGGMRASVRALDTAAPTRHGVMLLGPNSDTVVELIAYTYQDGSILRWESIPENATGMIVIVTGRIR